MKMSSRNKALLSGGVFLLGLLSLNFDGFGLIAMFVVIIAFFTMVIQGGLHLAGYRDGDVFDAYQDANRLEAGALKEGLSNKESK